MTAPAWLLVAAAFLALAAGWCANAEAALMLVSGGPFGRTGGGDERQRGLRVRAPARHEGEEGGGNQQPRRGGHQPGRPFASSSLFQAPSS